MLDSGWLGGSGTTETHASFPVKPDGESSESWASRSSMGPELTTDADPSQVVSVSARHWSKIASLTGQTWGRKGVARYSSKENQLQGLT